MAEHFNKLTPGEAERLAKLIEEAGEVIQASTKILRHGYDSKDPTNPDHKGNRADLQREIFDFMNTISLFLMAQDLNIEDFYEHFGKMMENDHMEVKYMHHQDGVEGVISV